MLANVRPSGKYLMEDFFYAGGLRALMQNLREKLDLSCLTVTGKTVAENIDSAKVYIPDVIHSLNDPVYAEGATAVLKGNLAPQGCVIKPAAADKRFLKHRGKAIAFEDYNHMMREIERDDLDVTPDHILVLKNAGPKGGPGMPEWGMLPIPKRLLGQGVRDMIRISDARMSGTSYGACILHVAPESFVGGPLTFVQTGDEIEIDVDKRAASICTSATKNSPAARPPGRSRRRNIRAATARSIRIISARPTRVAISIFSAPAVRSPSRKSINRYRPQDDGMMLTTAQKVRAFAIAIGLALAAAPALAQTYPGSPVHLIVAYSAGGTGDVVARIVAPKLSIALGQSVIVENRAGASGAIGAHSVATASPDGLTLLIGQTAEVAINQHWLKGLSYDPDKDLAPIAMLAIVPLALAVPAKAPYSTMAEFMAALRTKKLTFASAGTGTPGHFAGEFLQRVDLRFVRPSAVDGEHPRADVNGRGAQVVRDLDRQFPGRHHDQGPRLARRASRVCPDPLQERDAERQGLPRARPGLPDDVLPAQGQRESPPGWGSPSGPPGARLRTPANVPADWFVVAP